jgi:hypothetical protein
MTKANGAILKNKIYYYMLIPGKLFVFKVKTILNYFNSIQLWARMMMMMMMMWLMVMILLTLMMMLMSENLG